MLSTAGDAVRLPVVIIFASMLGCLAKYCKIEGKIQMGEGGRRR